jgi:SPP1 family predicted phage head-tail adaptor
MTRRLFTEITGTFRPPAPGELDKIAQFRTREDVPTDNFGTMAVYTPKFSTWAKLSPVGESIRIGSVQIDNAITHKVIIRYRTNITTDDEVVIKGIVYRVKGTTNLNNESRFLVVSVEELREDYGNP